MADRKELILRRLAEEGDKLIGYYQGLDPAAWEQVVYTEENGWTVRAVLAHQLSAEHKLRELVENILDGGSGAAADFPLDAFNEAEVTRLANIAPAEMLIAWRRARAALIRRIERICEADLDRHGRHPALGETSLEEIVRLIYRHNMMHARDVRRVLDGE